jgi:hypothetical protein
MLRYVFQYVMYVERGGSTAHYAEKIIVGEICCSKSEAWVKLVREKTVARAVIFPRIILGSGRGICWFFVSVSGLGQGVGVRQVGFFSLGRG